MSANYELEKIQKEYRLWCCSLPNFSAIWRSFPLKCGRLD